MSQTLTGIVLTKNEEELIEACLSSLSFCDEVLVIDDYSTDDTCKLASKAGAKVYQRRLQGDFAAQRNYGLKTAKSEWVLFVDADEVVTKDLAKEIKNELRNPRANAFQIKRVDIWKGREFQAGAGVQYIIRLAKKDSGVFTRRVHETWDQKDSIPLSGHLLHYPHPLMKDFLEHISRYAEVHAQENKREGKSATLLHITLVPPLKVLYIFFVKRGFQDGIYGFIYAMMMGFHSFLAWSSLYHEKSD